MFSWCVRECISGPGVQLRPGVEQAYVRGCEVTDVSRDHRQAVRQGSGRDQGVALCTRVWNMQPRAATCDCGIDRKDSSVKSRQHVMVLTAVDSRTNPASTAGTAQHDLDLVSG